MSLDIRPLTLVDEKAAYALECAAHAFPWDRTNFHQSLTNAYQRWALWQQDNLIGMAFFQVLKPEAELLNFAIAPAYQGQGLGQAFLRELLSRLQEQAIDRCFLEVRAGNVTAIKLYERLGFNQMGMRPGYYPGLRGREDACLYALEWFDPFSKP